MLTLSMLYVELKVIVIFCQHRAQFSCRHKKYQLSVNFINVLHAPFSYQIFGAKISNPKASFVIFGSKILHKKCVRKMLMKLTPKQLHAL